jgi:hypothetical protein
MSVVRIDGLAAEKIAAFVTAHAAALSLQMEDEPDPDGVQFFVRSKWGEELGLPFEGADELKPTADGVVEALQALAAADPIGPTAVALFMRHVAKSKAKAAKKSVPAAVEEMAAAVEAAKPAKPAIVPAIVPAIALVAIDPDKTEFAALTPAEKRAAIMAGHDAGLGRKDMAAAFGCRLTYVQDTVARGLAARRAAS